MKASEIGSEGPSTPENYGWTTVRDTNPSQVRILRCCPKCKSIPDVVHEDDVAAQVYLLLRTTCKCFGSYGTELSLESWNIILFTYYQDLASKLDTIEDALQQWMSERGGPAKDDDPPCSQCGGELDTGWECNDCGYDMRLELYPDFELVGRIRKLLGVS